AAARLATARTTVESAADRSTRVTSTRRSGAGTVGSDWVSARSAASDTTSAADGASPADYGSAVLSLFSRRYGPTRSRPSPRSAPAIEPLCPAAWRLELRRTRTRYQRGRAPDSRDSRDRTAPRSYARPHNVTPERTGPRPTVRLPLVHLRVD